mmetsp:Transcript_17336/g.48042  ORF Transcript_17336/g.48042 Transcript_17336/m.48042 type:complete len:229 (+) Transcript_17336:503-1189(+)
MKAISSVVKARSFLAGAPDQSSPLGTSVPAVTSDPGATMLLDSTTAPSITCADSPIMTKSLIVQAWTTAPARMETLLPMKVAWSPCILATWTTARSPMLVFDPTVILLTSPRTVAPYQTLECSPMETSPTTDADGATKLLAPETTGAMPSTETNRVDGTNRSVYFVTSICLPKLSIAAPALRSALEAATTTRVPMDVIFQFYGGCLAQMIVASLQLPERRGDPVCHCS